VYTDTRRCFFRLIAKADLSCFISRTGEGSTGEAEKVEEEREKHRGKGKKGKKVRKETCDSPIRAKNHDVLSRTPMHMHFLVQQETFLGKREANDSLHIYLSNSRLRWAEEVKRERATFHHHLVTDPRQ